MNRSQRHRVSIQEEARSLEERVSRVRREQHKRRGSWKAKDLLAFFGEYLRPVDRSHREKRERWVDPKKGYGPKSMGRRGSRSDIHRRAFQYVVNHERFKEYESVLLDVWVRGSTDTMAMERCSEFEIALDSQLDKIGFSPDQDVEQAKDRMYALVSISTCAMALGVAVKTVHRWIDAGLAGEVYGGYAAVQKLGAYYWVNYWAARDWQEKKSKIAH